MAEFRCYGPFQVPSEKRYGGGRTVIRDDFWLSAPELRDLESNRGVYVFTIKPPGKSTHTPCYVGQAKRSFGKEALHNDKLLKYEHAMADYKSGRPHLFFLVHPKGKPNRTQIAALEDYLIMMGFAVNSNIQNDKGAKLPDWSIAGLIRSPKKPTDAARDLGRMFDFKSRKGV